VKNGLGSPADADVFLGCEPVGQPGAGARPGGSRTVAASTPIRISAEAPAWMTAELEAAQSVPLGADVDAEVIDAEPTRSCLV
jgi:hypothetical protein